MITRYACSISGCSLQRASDEYVHYRPKDVAANSDREHTGVLIGDNSLRAGLKTAGGGTARGVAAPLAVNGQYLRCAAGCTTDRWPSARLE